jgi:uncharacterized lipoprotein YajG
MNQVRFASFVTALLAVVMLGGCAKTQDAASTSEAPPAAGDAAAPESEASSTEASTEGATDDPSSTPSDSEAPTN